jgi:uncharacterized Zn-binding protein involved in type VI secretion
LKLIAQLGCLATSDNDGLVHSIEASSNVVVNGLGVVRLGDRFSNGEVVVTASSNVYANGKKVARIGDKLSDGGIIISTPNNTDKYASD